MHWTNWSRYGAIIAGIIVLATVVWFLGDIVGYVIIAWVLSLLGRPVMNFFRKYLRIGRFRVGSVGRALLTILIFYLFLGLAAVLFAPMFVEQAVLLSKVDYTAIAKNLEEPLSHLNAWLHKYGVLAPGSPDLQDQLTQAIKANINPNLLSGAFGSILGALGNIFFALGTITFILFFFLREQHLFTQFIVTLVPQQYEEAMRHAIDDITELLTRYFGGLVIEVAAFTILVSTGLWILGVPYAFALGLLAGLLNIIPYIGPLIGASIGILVALASNIGLDFYNELVWLVLKVFLVYQITQWIDNFFLQPYLFSKSVLAHPLEIFLVIIIGAKLDGVTGMVLAIPAYTVLRVVARVFFSEFRIVQMLTDSVSQLDDEPENNASNEPEGLD
jgi:predicted PurR-regulated permease PerM